MKIIYCGYGRAGVECFYQMISNFHIDENNVIVFTHNTTGNEEFIEHLQNNNIEYHYDSINKYHSKLKAFGADYLVSVYYRNIISSTILDLVGYRAMNLHPSLLPRYRGTKSSVWAILNGEHTTGITFHYIDAKVDNGKILFQKSLQIQHDDTAYRLYHKLVSLFVQYFKVAFEKLINGHAGIDQEGEISYYKRELPFGGKRNFKDTTIQEALRFVRAMYFPPHRGAIFITENGEEIEISNVKVLDKYLDLFRS